MHNTLITKQSSYVYAAFCTKTLRNTFVSEKIILGHFLTSFIEINNLNLKKSFCFFTYVLSQCSTTDSVTALLDLNFSNIATLCHYYTLL